ncbi:MAG: RNA polymerase sigma factor [Anaerolineae bacterium]
MNVEPEEPLLRLEEATSPDHSFDPYDRQLVERTQAGDAEAFVRLCGVYAERLYGYLLFQVQDEQVAEQLTAQVFVSVWLNIPCYKPGEPRFSAWLYLIARQAVSDYRREHGGECPIMEITSPADKGLEAYKVNQPCASAAETAA